jgi:hypothetical protein
MIDLLTTSVSGGGTKVKSPGWAREQWQQLTHSLTHYCRNPGSSVTEYRAVGLLLRHSRRELTMDKYLCIAVG